MDIITTIITAVIGGVVPAVAVVVSMRTQIDNVREDLRNMRVEISKAHDRLDNHVVQWHKDG